MVRVSILAALNQSAHRAYVRDTLRTSLEITYWRIPDHIKRLQYHLVPYIRLHIFISYLVSSVLFKYFLVEKFVVHRSIFCKETLNFRKVRK